MSESENADVCGLDYLTVLTGVYLLWREGPIFFFGIWCLVTGVLVEFSWQFATVFRDLNWSSLCTNAGLIAVMYSIHDTIRYDTIEEFNVDSKAEYTA